MSRPAPRYPALFELNTRVWITERSRTLGRPATLDDVPDSTLDDFVRQGFDWIWLLSVWQTGSAAQTVSRSNPEWRREFEQTLPDLTESDIGGSGFAISGYSVHAGLGGDAALARLRERMKSRGLRLMLDFVPNHLAPDHPWVASHPDYFVQGTDADLAREPHNYVRVPLGAETRVFAHGRDPYFPGWPDTLQLNYGNPVLQQALTGELLRMASQCDGLRCDMAMLVLPEVFQRTWNVAAPDFWPTAISRIREQHPDFVFLAEAYWDLEWALQQQGFDYCYDKRLYDRLKEGHARSVRDHLTAGLDFQDRLARFLENHDEPRAAAVFPGGRGPAAAVVTYLTPGLRFFHQGQFEGRRKRISPHLIRAPDEPIDPDAQALYSRLLGLLRQPAFRDGDWTLLASHPAWEGNGTHDDLIAFGWRGPEAGHWIVVVNQSDHASQGKIRLAGPFPAGARLRLEDRWNGRSYDWNRSDLDAGGLFVDLPAWGVHVLEVLPPNP